MARPLLIRMIFHTLETVAPLALVGESARIARQIRGCATALGKSLIQNRLARLTPASFPTRAHSHKHKKSPKAKPWGFFINAYCVRDQACLRRRRLTPNPTRPKPISAMLVGSGTPNTTSSEPLMLCVPATWKEFSWPDWNETL